MDLNRYSILDKISDSISPVLRRLNDVNQNLYGTNVQLLRIYRVVEPYYNQKNVLQNRSVLGDFKEKLESKVINNIYIKYPFSAIEIFQKKQMENNKIQDSITSIDVSDILPIEAEIKFEGDYETDPIQINLGDKLVDVFYDHNLNPMPVILEVMKFFGNYFGKNIVSKKVNLSIHRGSLNTEIDNLVNKYISEISIDKKSIRQRRF
jgi:hypothetical protein